MFAFCPTHVSARDDPQYDMGDISGPWGLRPEQKRIAMYKITKRVTKF